MARVNFRVRQYTDPLKRAIKALPEIKDEMDTIGQIAEVAAKQMIDSRPSLKSGKPGRATGTDMSADVDHTVKATQAYKYQLRVGWLNRAEDWYRLQDQGFMFVHAAIPFWIEGTDALEDTADLVDDMIEEAVQKHRKKIARLAVGKN